MKKKCSKCKELKDKSEFFINKTAKDKLTGQCKPCVKAVQARYKQGILTKPRIVTVAPQSTVFSIDSTTGKPYVDYNDVKKLTLYAFKHHVNKTILNRLLEKVEIEDLYQEVNFALIKFNYDPKKSKPSTFITMVTKSQLGKMYDYHFNSSDRHLVSSDILINTDTGPQYITDVHGVNNITPEEVLLAAEKVEQFYENEAKLRKDQRRLAPPDYKGIRSLKKSTQVDVDEV